MKVTIELAAGPSHMEHPRFHIQKNIDALKRAIDGEMNSGDFVNLIDTLSILWAIKEQLDKG